MHYTGLPLLLLCAFVTCSRVDFTFTFAINNKNTTEFLKLNIGSAIFQSPCSFQ